MAREQLGEQCVTLWDGECLIVTSEQSERVERQTRGQLTNRMWHRFGTGSIIASNIKKYIKRQMKNLP